MRLRARQVTQIALAMMFLCNSAVAQTVTCTTPPTVMGPATPYNGNPNQLIFIDTFKYPQAKCADGSDPTIIVRMGVGRAANRVLISLAAGSSSDTDAEGYQRWYEDTDDGSEPAKLTGSEYFGTPGNVNQANVNLEMGANNGILSAYAEENPGFNTATEVRVNYCTQDDFEGTVYASGQFNPANLGTWNQDGRVVLTAAIDTLLDMGIIASGDETMFFGQSAGGEGAEIEANYVGSLMPPDIRFVVMGDSGTYNSSFGELDLTQPAPFVSLMEPTATQADMLVSWQAWGAIGDQGCDDAVIPGATTQWQQAVLCRDPGYLLDNGFVKYPTLIIESLDDPWILSNLGVTSCVVQSNCDPATPKDAAESQYVAAFSANMEQTILLGQSGGEVSDLMIQYPQHIFTTNQYYDAQWPLVGLSQTSTIAALLELWYVLPCPGINYETQPVPRSQ